MGLLERPIITVHCVTIPIESLTLVNNKPFNIATTPSSGMRNDAGITPIGE